MFKNIFFGVLTSILLAFFIIIVSGYSNPLGESDVRVVERDLMDREIEMLNKTYKDCLDSKIKNASVLLMKSEHYYLLETDNELLLISKD